MIYLFLDMKLATRDHIQKHGEKEFMCTLCRRTFSASFTCEVHVMSDHVERHFVFKCHLCDTISKNRHCLRLHMKNRHSTKVTYWELKPYKKHADLGVDEPDFVAA